MATAQCLGTEEHDVSAGVDTVLLDGSSIDTELTSFKKNVWKTKEFSDFTLKSSGGRMFKVHKAFIAPHMTYFIKYSAELSQDCALVDVESNVLEMVLEYLYEGQLEVTRDHISKLQSAAEYLGVNTLKKQCQYAVLSETKMTLDNCLDMWNFAIDVSDRILHNKALRMVLENFDTIQQQPEYNQLSFVNITELLTNGHLKVHSPDEKLGAALNWAMHDPESRLPHLPTILDLLPLHLMQKWYLKQIMLNPGVKANNAACSKLRTALDAETPKTQPNRDSWQAPQRQLIPESATQSPIQSTHLIALTFKQVKDSSGRYLDSEGVMWSVGLQDDVPVIKVGKTRAENLPSGARICSSKDGRMFTGGLGKDARELWMFTLQPKQTMKLASFKVGRKFHAMCYKNGRIFILGGRLADGTSLNSVEVFNVKDKTITTGALEYGGVGVCCLAHDADSILVFNSKGHTSCLQVYSITSRKTICVATLPLQSLYPPLCILQVDNNTLLLLTCMNTTVCTMDDLKQSETYTFKEADNYTLPNYNSLVALSADRQHILLLGGNPKPARPQHFVYRAKITDILQNTVDGWEKVNSEWSLGSCHITAYTTVAFPTDG